MFARGSKGKAVAMGPCACEKHLRNVHLGSAATRQLPEKLSWGKVVQDVMMRINGGECSLLKHEIICSNDLVTKEHLSRHPNETAWQSSLFRRCEEDQLVNLPTTASGKSPAYKALIT